MAELMRYAQIEENRRMYAGPRYEAAYQQVNTRIAARETILIGYIAAAATLIGVSLGSPDLRRIALVIPYMAAAVGLILFNHENVIMQLEEYLADICINMPSDWYHRGSLGEDRRRGLGYRTVALLVIIGGSSAIAVGISRDIAANMGNILVWYGDIIFTVFTSFLVVWPRVRRIQQYSMWIQFTLPPVVKTANW